MDRLLEKDMVVRIISVMLAVVIWAQVSSDQVAQKTRRLEIPLAQVGLNAGLQVMDLPATVSLEFKGSPENIDRLQPAQVKALADLSGLKEPGSFEVPVTVSTPTGSDITVSSAPGHVSVTIEARLSVRRRPEISPQGPVLDGDRRVAVEQPDQEITVSGLSTQMSKVDRVVGDISLTSIERTGPRTVSLKAVDAAGEEIRGVSLSPERIDVNVTVTPLPPGRLVPVKPQWQGTVGNAFSLSAEVSPRVVRVRGPVDQQGTWTEVLTEPIPLTGRTQSFSVVARLIRPNGAQYMDEDTVTVNVTLGEAPDQKLLKNVPLKMTGLQPTLLAVPSITEVQVTLSGPRGLVAAVDATKVEAFLDLENLQVGEHRLKVAVQGAPGLDATANPETVSVLLSEKEKHQ